uniref:Polyprotein protein n=1 Tax=Solanum tuberosum TaxID=4113 RepID=M1DMA2_SOLTU
MRLDNLIARLEAKEKAKSSSSVLDTIRGQLITLRVDTSSSVKQSIIVEGVAIFIEDVVDDDEWVDDDLAEETDED